MKAAAGALGVLDGEVPHSLDGAAGGGAALQADLRQLPDVKEAPTERLVHPPAPGGGGRGEALIRIAYTSGKSPKSACQRKMCMFVNIQNISYNNLRAFFCGKWSEKTAPTQGCFT